MASVIHDIPSTVIEVSRNNPQEHCVVHETPGHSDFWLEICATTTQLREYTEDWDQLARISVEPNVYYESWMLLAGLELIDFKQDMRFVFVYRKNKRITDPPILCGFFPLSINRTNIPGVKNASLYTNVYSYLSTPLLHPDYASPAYDMLLNWAKKQGFAFIEIPRMLAEGASWQALYDVLNDYKITPFVFSQYNRALLSEACYQEDIRSISVSGHSRRDMNRLRRRLQDIGQLEFRRMEHNQIHYWCDIFLELEAKGWKGDTGTALNHTPEHEQFFRQVVELANQRGQLQMLGLFLNGEPIALKCNLLSQPGSFAWKIAFDEELAKYSPGVQLELDNMDEFQKQESLEWMDSCAVASHPMINRLWKTRRTIQHLFVPTGGWSGELLTACWPVARYFKKRLRFRNTFQRDKQSSLKKM